MLNTRSEVQEKIGVRVTAMKQLMQELSLSTEDRKYYEGFIEGVAQLSGLMVETCVNEAQRRQFLADCGFPAEQEVA